MLSKNKLLILIFRIWVMNTEFTEITCWYSTTSDQWLDFESLISKNKFSDIRKSIFWYQSWLKVDYQSIKVDLLISKVVEYQVIDIRKQFSDIRIRKRFSKSFLISENIIFEIKKSIHIIGEYQKILKRCLIGTWHLDIALLHKLETL